MLSTIYLSSLLSFAMAVNASPIVQLGSTKITGASFGNVEFYGGIPYATPPLGSLRFKSPVPLGQLNSTALNATQFGPGCLQPPTGAQAPNTSEDCLSINVFRPAGLEADTALPIMAWIHGGGSIFGSAANYNAGLNYRLGPLGFAQGRDASDENALNLGLKDQLAALQWIQDNISAFGGDKSKVTLFGESAGSAAISTLFLNSNVEKFARAAIFESGASALLPVTGPLTKQLDWDNFVHAVPECANYTGSSIDCLRGADATALQQAIATSWAESTEGYPFAPVINGPHGLIPALPSVLLAEGKFARLPFIAGSNLDEGTYFANPLVNSTAQIKAFLVANYSTSTEPSKALESAVDRLLELYPDIPALGSPYNTGNETFGFSSQFKRLASIMGDLMVTSQRREWTQTASEVGVKTYGYLFTDPGAPPISPPTIGPKAPAAALGVPHTSDMVYIFNLTAPFHRPASAAALSTQMVDYWLSFATSLDPNDGLGSTRPTWSQYSCSDQRVLELNSGNSSMISDNFREEQIKFISSKAALFRQ
ncbi:extracellular triacylglycerol lipase precursor [Mycena filopes]|nr:extracellular triacylglycerol lipase precursor [Mycena filopes]